MNSLLAPEWQEQWIDANGIKLHCVTAGAGELMLCLHGFPEFWYSWRYQLAEFSPEYKVVALDLRGYNDSDKPLEKSAYRMDVLIEDIKSAIAALGYQSCILVGHDWGGAIAWQFSYAYPEKVKQLIIMNLPHPAKFRQGLRTPQQLLKSWYIFFFQLPLLPEWVFRAKDYTAIANAFYKMAIDKSAFPPNVLDAYRQAAAKPGALTAMINYYRNVFSSLGEMKVSEEKLKIPTLLIWGECDTALGKELTTGTDAYVEELTLHYIPNCSHWVQQEQPQRVNRLMRDFLGQV
jgi:pimeloyl-ACP methyl ester carboxylesterase